MILDGGSRSSTQDREYPNHNNAPIPKYLLSPETREQMRRDREAEKARREANRLRRMQRAEEKRKAVHEPSEPAHRVVSGRYDMDTREIVTEGPLKGRQVMFTMCFDMPGEGLLTLFGRRRVIRIPFRFLDEVPDPDGIGKALGKFIEENREALGV